MAARLTSFLCWEHHVWRHFLEALCGAPPVLAAVQGEAPGAMYEFTDESKTKLFLGSTKSCYPPPAFWVDGALAREVVVGAAAVFGALASPHQQRGGRGDGSNRVDALGRLLTTVLRHMAPELSLGMRSDGYVRARDLLGLSLQTFAKAPLKSHSVDEIREAVRRDNKQRFSLLEEDGELLIRANQGHTVTTVASESLLKPILSADEVSVCVHGTYRKNLDSILQHGLKRMERLHVHFSSGLPSDEGVISGMRRSANILIHLDVHKALQDGMKLYISDNKVILTEGFDGVVPVKYLEKMESWPGRPPIPFQR
ncbi:tRNA 2'-phosphotransferase 1 [Triticum aestivum]|uniref:tRNA 2'-phosphotransferase 1 n=1 Tax=Triticum aestivum TaxID=4565 RepID=UPI001D035B80|nr:tRNA 2'-phosphotransferase 1-like [Triticum aestivum]